MRGALHFLTAVLIAVIPVVAGAQDQGLRDRDPQLDQSKRIAIDLQRATMHYGPFYLLSSIQLADVGYERTDQFWVPTSDQATGFTLGVNAPQRLYFVPRKKVVFSLEAVPGYSFYANDDGDDIDEESDDGYGSQFGYTTRGSMQLLLNHLYLDTYVGLSDTLRANVGEINRLATVRENTYGVNGEYKHSSKTSIFFAGNKRASEYPRDRLQPEDHPVQLLGRDETNGRVSLFHKTFPRTSLIAAVEGNQYNFDELTTRDSRRNYAGVGLAYENSRTLFRVEAGAARLDFERSANDFEGLTGSANFSQGIGDRLAFQASLIRDVEFSIFQDNTYYVLDRLMTSLEYTVFRNWVLRASGHVGRDLYDVPVNGILRRDDLSFYSGGVIYSTSRTRAGVEVGWFERDTNIGGDVRDGIRLILHLSFTPR